MGTSTRVQDLRSRVRHDGRGLVGGLVVRAIKRLWDRFGLAGYAIAVVVLFVVTYYVFTAVFGTTSAVFSQGDVTALSSLVAVTYTGWIGFNTYEQYTDRDLSRRIRERPSVDTVDDAFGLLGSNDERARVNASICLNSVVAISPKNVVNTVDAPTDEVIDYLLPYIEPESEEVSRHIGDVIAFLARDYPEDARPFRDELLGMVRDPELADAVRGNLSLAVGFLVLSDRTGDDELRPAAMELSRDDHPGVRIGACYMLAGIPSRETQRRLRAMADDDPEQEVREHAEELI